MKTYTVKLTHQRLSSVIDLLKFDAEPSSSWVEARIAWSIGQDLLLRFSKKLLENRTTQSFSLKEHEYLALWYVMVHSGLELGPYETNEIRQLTSEIDRAK